MYFKEYITGAIRSEVVDICGERKSLDAWRIMADRGCSQRPDALQDRLANIIAPNHQNIGFCFTRKKAKADSLPHQRFDT